MSKDKIVQALIGTPTTRTINVATPLETCSARFRHFHFGHQYLCLVQLAYHHQIGVSSAALIGVA